MVKYRARVRVGSGPAGALRTFRSFRNNSRKSAFLKSMRNFRNDAFFESIHGLLKRCIYYIQHISKTHLLVLLPRDFPAGILRRKNAIAVSMSVLERCPKLMPMTSDI